MKKILCLVFFWTLRFMGMANAEPSVEFYIDNKLNGGVRLQTSYSDIRINTRPSQNTFAAAVYTKNLCPRLPVTLKTGNLSAAGSLSRLNSPELSAGTSPFSFSIASPAQLSANLPSFTGYEKPFGLFLEIEVPFLFGNLKTKNSKTVPKLIINTLATEQNTLPLSSAKIILPFTERISLTTAITQGWFIYDENQASSWFLKLPYYSADKHFCTLYQLEFDIKKNQKSPGLSTCFTAGLYQTPFSFPAGFLRTDFKFSTHRTDSFVSVFYNPYNYLLTSSDKMLNPSFQLKSGFNYKTLSAFFSTLKQTPVFIKAGFNAYLKINLNQTEHPLKINAGFQYSTDKTSCSLTTSLNQKILNQQPLSKPEKIDFSSLAFQLKNSWYLKNVVPSGSIQITFQPQKNEETASKYKINVSAATAKKIKVNANASFSFTHKKGEFTEKKLSANISSKFSIKMIIFTVKLSSDFEI